jgi:hypothetical protein
MVYLKSASVGSDLRQLSVLGFKQQTVDADGGVFTPGGCVSVLLWVAWCVARPVPEEGFVAMLTRVRFYCRRLLGSVQQHGLTRSMVRRNWIEPKRIPFLACRITRMRFSMSFDGSRTDLFFNATRGETTTTTVGARTIFCPGLYRSEKGNQHSYRIRLA